MDEHLRFRHLFAVVWMVFPFVSVVVSSPLVSVVFREVRRHVPQRCLIVVEMVVKVKKPGVNGTVCLVDGYVCQDNI